MISARDLLKVANGEEEEAPQRPLTSKEKETLKSFFKAHPSPSDDQVHELAESMGVSPHSLEEEIYKMVRVEKTGQRHEHVPDTKYNSEQLRMGVEVEKEHTDDPKHAKEIAKDHLAELPDYYTRLKKMESEGEKAKEGSFEHGFYAELQKIAKDMPDFTKQDRPKKVKEIYRALKRDHPDMPAEMKARIAARQGKPGKQHQGPPYKGPLTKTSKKSWMSWIQTNLNPFAQGGRAKAPKASKAFGGTSNQKLLAQYMK